ncbi:MAG: tetratricopeptide repeat protein [bacterium]
MATRFAAAVLILAILTGRSDGATAPVGDDVTAQSPSLSDSEIRHAAALAHYSCGLIAYSTNPVSEEAKVQLEEAFKLDPGQMDVTLRLALHYQSRGMTNDLLRVLQCGCEKNPGDIGLRYYLASVYQAAALYDNAVAEFSRIIKLQPRNAAGYFGVTQAHLLREDERGALSSLRNGLRNSTNNECLIAVCGQIGAASVVAGKWDEAVECLTLLRTIEPDNAGAFLNLLDAHLCNGDTKGAKSLLRLTPAKYRGSMQFNYIIARHLLGAGQYKEALAYFDKIGKSPGDFKGADDFRDSVYYHRYGVACERSGKYEIAVVQFEKSIQMDGKNAESLNYLAYMWAERSENLDRAVEYVKRALDASPANPAYLDTLGWIYFKQHKIDSALEQVENAHDLLPGEAVIADHLGDILQARKETAKAVSVWKESFLIDSGSADVARKLKEYGVDMRRLRREAKAAQEAARAADAKSHEED